MAHLVVLWPQQLIIEMVQTNYRLLAWGLLVVLCLVQLVVVQTKG